MGGVPLTNFLPKNLRPHRFWKGIFREVERLFDRFCGILSLSEWWKYQDWNSKNPNFQIEILISSTLIFNQQDPDGLWKTFLFGNSAVPLFYFTSWHVWKIVPKRWKKWTNWGCLRLLFRKSWKETIPQRMAGNKTSTWNSCFLQFLVLEDAIMYYGRNFLLHSAET